MTTWQEKVLDYLKRPAHRITARRVNTQGVRSLCMALGPNRNMTTLTASLIALHPQCQVLNNAAYRIMGRASALLDAPSGEEFQRFLRDAIFKSLGGRRGHYGGTITLSHAFDRPAVKDAYRRRFGDSVLKPDISCVYWKSAVQLTAHVREHQVDLGRVVEQNPRLRFLMPIRNPLDCAMSNFRLGHYRHFKEVADAPVDEVADFFVQLIAWFRGLRARYPENFFCYFQKDYGRQMLIDLASFLEVDADETWISDCLQTQIKGKPYEYADGQLDKYKDSLSRHLAGDTEAQEKLAAQVGS